MLASEGVFLALRSKVEAYHSVVMSAMFCYTQQCCRFDKTQNLREDLISSKCEDLRTHYEKLVDKDFADKRRY